MIKTIVLGSLLVISSVSFGASNDTPETITVQMLAGEMAAHKPQICLGFEHLVGIKNTISGREAITKAVEGWAAFSKIVSDQTGYEVEINDWNVLVRPKVVPDQYTAPIVTQLVRFTQDPVSWKTLGEAVKNIKFADPARKFDPLLTFEFASAEHIEINFRPALLPAVKRLTEANTSRGVTLSDTLFMLARSIGAKQWNYAPFDIVPDGQNPPKPQKLAFASLTFAGKLDD